jgi:membrane-bound serine protease (ClpP class)
MFDLGWQAWALLGAGLVVVAVEVFSASSGLFTLLAILFFVGGGWLAWQKGGSPAVGGFVACVLVLSPVVLFGSLKVLPRTPFGRRMILARPVGTTASAAEEGLAMLVGQQGRTETPLRPVGIANFGERRVDVVTRGKHLPAGAAVRVLKVEGNRVVVEGVAS